MHETPIMEYFVLDIQTISQQRVKVYKTEFTKSGNSRSKEESRGIKRTFPRNDWISCASLIV